MAVSEISTSYYSAWRSLLLCSSSMAWSLHKVQRLQPENNFWSETQIRKSCNVRCLFHRGMVNDMKQIRKSCHLCCLFHRGMVDDMKQIRKSCNLCSLFHCDMVDDSEFSIFFCSCLLMINDTKVALVTC